MYSTKICPHLGRLPHNRRVCLFSRNASIGTHLAGAPLLISSHEPTDAAVGKACSGRIGVGIACATGQRWDVKTCRGGGAG